MSEVRATIFSFIAKNATLDCSVPIKVIVAHVVSRHDVSEILVMESLDDMVAFGLIQVSPDGAILTPLSFRLTQ